MAEQNPKRHREESDDFHKEESKRHKPYDQILSIFEEEQDVYIQDLSDIFTDLQQELSFDDSAPTGENLHIFPSPVADSDQNSFSPDEEDNKLSMMRHLLEASDDELGIPNRVESGDEGAADGGDGGGGIPVGYLGDGFWEFEDEAANYYAILQSELLM